MPIIDMPIAELKKYQGTNPRPQDFDAYWEHALAEMHALPLDAEFIPADFQVPFADCFHMYFTGVNGARIYAKLLKPKKIEGKVPAILQFHGYSANSGDWVHKLAYVAAGFVVAAMDCRGQGGLSEDVGGVKGNTLQGHVIRGMAEKDPQKLLFRDIFLDTAQLARIIMELSYVDETNVSSWGGSQGGGLSIACAALEPRISKVVAQYPFLCDYKRVWDMDLTSGAVPEIPNYFRRFDPRHQREAEFFTKLGYIDVQNLANRIRGKVLMATGLMDSTCPPSTQFAVYNKIQSPKRMELYPDFGHEGFPELDDIIFQFLLQ